MARLQRKSKKRSHVLTPDQARQLFDRQAQKYLKMSGKKFVEKWDAGGFNGKSDTPNVMQVAMLLPFAR